MAFYTVTEFAKKAGISARMLRHYDEKGLLKPSGYSEGGYRLYTDEDMAVLQRIVSLRYLNFSLPQIKSALQMEQGQDIRASLRRQKEEFEREQEHLRQIIQALDTLEKEEEFEWQRLSELMQIINSEEQVQKRFEDSWRRDRCADLHYRYSTNPDQWLRFLYRQMDVKAGDRILEIDASDGVFWTENADRLPNCHITQTAPSEAVLDRIRGNMEAAEWKEGCHFNYALVPTGRISLPKQSYDVIVANHLFIHSSELAHVLETCSDALKPDGYFYCTAIGHGHMKELLDLAIEFDSGVHFYNMDCLQNFSMENGAALLGRHFGDVAWHPFIDSIETEDANALLDYLWGTYSNIQTVLAHKRDGLLRHIQNRIREKGKLISLRMTVLYLILLPPLVWLLQRISRKSQVLQKQALEQKSEMAEWIRQSCRAMETIQAFQMEPIMMEQMKQKNESVKKLAVSSDRYRIRLTLVKYVVSIGSLVVVLLAGKGESLETLVAFSVLSVYIQGGLEMLDHIFYTYRLCKADIESLKELERSL